MSSKQEIRLLGAFRATNGNTPISDLSAPRIQSLLAYLILNADTAHPRQHLAFVLWPDSTERQARTNLRKLVHQLRNTLPDAEESLLSTRSTIQWNANSPYCVDVLELERLLSELDADPHSVDLLKRIGELYTGELVPGCYDDWIGPLRADLHRRAHHALGTLVDQLEDRREYSQAIEYVWRLIELDPLDEAGYRKAMRLLSLHGDRAGALRAYRECEAILERELGVEPSEETRLVYERILVSEESTVPAVRRNGARGREDQLVGRGREWRLLQAAWQRAEQGRAHLVVLGGEAGIGKSRLAEELLVWARQQGYRAERTRSYAAHGALAYAPIAELLRAESLRADLARLEPVWLSEIARLLPELLAADAGLPEPQPMAESWQRQRFFDALARAVPADDAPLLLLFDDLQWADRETLEWFTYLLQRSPQCRLLVVGTVRTDEVDGDHPYTEVEMALSHSGQLVEIPLARLSHDDTAALAAQIADRELMPEQVAQLYQDTEGNPLFVVESVRALHAEESMEALPAYAAPGPEEAIARLPGKVHAVIRGRLARLSPRAHELASLAAVAGRSFSYDVLRRSSGQDEETLADGLDELLHRRIVLERGTDAFDFSHDRIRDVAYAEISRVRRRLLHDRVAQAMVEQFGEELDSVSGELAEHYVQAGRKQEAIEFLIRAGDRSADQFANEEALEYFARALLLLPEDELEQRYAILVRRLDVLVRIQDVAQRPSALDELERVIDELDARDRPALRLRGDLLTRRAQFAYHIGDPLEAKRLGFQAIEIATELHDPDVDYAARAVVGYAHWALGEMQAVRDLLSEPLARAKQEGRDDIAAGLMSRLAATGMFSGMPPAELAGHVNGFLAIYRATGNIEGQGDGYNKLGYLHVHAIEGKYCEAIRAYERAMELGRRTGSPAILSLCASNFGYLYTVMGDYAAAHHYLDLSLDRSRNTEFVQREGTILVYIGYAHRNRGDFSAALASQEAALALLSEIRLPLWGTWACRELALIRRALGQYELAEQHAREAVDIARKFGDTRQEGYALTALGLTLEDQGCPEAADSFRQAIGCYREMELYNRSMAPLAGLARLAFREGDEDQARALLEQILEHVAAHELDKTEEGFRIYETCYRLLQEFDDPRAAGILCTVQEHLRVRADSLTDPEQLRLFWNMAGHRQIRDERAEA